MLKVMIRINNRDKTWSIECINLSISAFTIVQDQMIFLKFFHHRVFFDFGPAPIIWIKIFKVT